MHGAEHFFHGRLAGLRAMVIEFLAGKTAFSG
jgi:alpha/beta superfamily hydrolase